VCSTLNSDFPADWELVLDFLGRHTSPGSGRVGDNIKDCVTRSDIGPSLPGGIWAQLSNHAKAESPLGSGQVLNLQKESTDLHDRISRNSVSIDSFIFPSLSKTVGWCIQHLPGDVYQALICMDAPSMLHGIGREFSSNQNTRQTLYQNKKAGILSFALTLHSSFSTVLPEILGKSNTVGVEGNELLLPCAKTYKDCFCNENGVKTGVKTQILSGLEHQRTIHDEVLTILSFTHPVGAQLCEIWTILGQSQVGTMLGGGGHRRLGTLKPCWACIWVKHVGPRSALYGCLIGTMPRLALLVRNGQYEVPRLEMSRGGKGMTQHWMP
jgi:hypothetical protein